MIYPTGRYECDGQVPIVVTDNGDLHNGYHGPWIHYRFIWDEDKDAKPVLYGIFAQLIAVGYRHVPGGDISERQGMNPEPYRGDEE